MREPHAGANPLGLLKISFELVELSVVSCAQFFTSYFVFH